MALEELHDQDTKITESLHVHGKLAVSLGSSSKALAFYLGTFQISLEFFFPPGFMLSENER
jgi:hypothetical protein